MESLIRVIYVCSTPSGINEHEILRLLKQARIANRKQDVSGMLLYIGGFFLQTLEGQPSMVNAVSGTLFRDKPRLRLTQIAREPIEEREFSEWTMGFATVDPLEAGRLLGDESLFRCAPSVVKLDPEGAKTLLTIFGGGATRPIAAACTGRSRAPHEPERRPNVGERTDETLPDFVIFTMREPAR